MLTFIYLLIFKFFCKRFCVDSIELVEKLALKKMNLRYEKGWLFWCNFFYFENIFKHLLLPTLALMNEVTDCMTWALVEQSLCFAFLNEKNH